LSGRYAADRRVVTQVKQWRQRSLFTSEELRPYRKDRQRFIRERLAKEARKQ
jgi:hypothetical protein